mmetsp:Transcript_16971/g.47552  ORF Transcript_16971/g.47552 Transcript_16971/m.47552 type:complete len:217 (-) Transcript_16971:9-659(-)
MARAASGSSARPRTASPSPATGPCGTSRGRGSVPSTGTPRTRSSPAMVAAASGCSARPRRSQTPSKARTTIGACGTPRRRESAASSSTRPRPSSLATATEASGCCARPRARAMAIGASGTRRRTARRVVCTDTRKIRSSQRTAWAASGSSVRLQTQTPARTRVGASGAPPPSTSGIFTRIPKTRGSRSEFTRVGRLRARGRLQRHQWNSRFAGASR